MENSTRTRRQACIAGATRALIEDMEIRSLLSGSVLATVANDANANGVLNATDPRLAGWTVFVDYNRNATQDAGEPSAVTNSNGEALISNVVANTWDVREIVPAGYTPAAGFKDFDRVRVRDSSTATVTFLNVASTPTDGIAGTVWNDINRDGVRDATDPGLPGWTVWVDLNDDRIQQATEPSAVTDANGKYTFTGLAAGRYRLREVTPTGWDPTVGSDGANTVNVVAGSVVTSDFGNFNIAGFGIIRGTVWNDVNADGARAAGDPGLGNWSVFLDLNTNGALNAGEPTALTDAAGVYTFPSVAAGTYQVTAVMQPGWNLSPGHPISVSATANTENPGVADFAFWTPTAGSISGTVYNDLDGNGIRTAGEAGLDGWNVFIDANNNGTLDAGENAVTTAADGTYTLANVPIGAFNVREIPAATFTPTAPGTGVQLVSVANGTNVAGINFGNKQRTDSAISGAAFFDANKNGVRDAGERGLPGMQVYLDLNNNGLHDIAEPSTTTSADLFYTPAVNEAGDYSFTHLSAGSYVVREVVPDLLSATPAADRVNSVTLVTGEARANVNFADRYRANELHGVVFDDINKNHVQDTGEAGISGVTVYIDLNRNNFADVAEPRTVTDTNGVYSFTTDLGPGSYVIRALHHSGRETSYPTTTGGILYPTSVSNPTIGNVTPGSITTSLAKNQTESHTVSLTLPPAGTSITNKVDVFLLFDDTGSFTGNSPIVRAAFPQIIAALQAAMPSVDFGFGVGRFEEYGNFAAENATGRPFILNQPILSASTPGFSTSIQAALDRTAPGYGGDQPETDIEALFQTATGRGFDGNNNGTTTDSGAAGQVSTQVTPGASGDVPSFSSFTVDPAGNVLPPDGNIGGAGFRSGALPIILTATDTGFAFQPRGETSVTGVDGLTLPISAFTQTSRNTTPFASGAGIQETVTALNALGALVIGLGTNGTANIDPRQGLEALAKLTGAVNHSVNTIPNGTLDPIAPGGPLYFQISSGFGASVSNGIIEAIQNAATNVAVDVTVRASDPTVHLSAVPDTIPNVGAGQTATFDVTFEGDGRPHRFDLQFVRTGTNVVLGSIPVVIGTPIVGDGYDYVELEDGEIHVGDDFGDSYNSALPTNTAPTFTAGDDQTVSPDSGPHSVAGWASGISAGPADDAGQVIDFRVSTDNDSLFSSLPIVAEDGTLTYTPAPGATGSAVVTVLAHDSGGTVGGGQDTSAARTFTITIGSPSPLLISSAFSNLARQSLTFDFSQSVAGLLNTGTVQVINLTTGLPVAIESLTYDAATRRATALFPAGTLPDGRYTATITAGSLPNLPTAHVLNFVVLAGDANGDAKVNFNDYLILQNHFGQAGTVSEGDLNRDGTVDFTDFLLLQNNFGKTV